MTRLAASPNQRSGFPTKIAPPARNFSVARGDVVAGLSVAGLLLPEAVAYAAIAGLAPGRAVVAAIMGCLVYAVAGRSRFAIISPTSSSAAILAATLMALPGSVAERGALATLIVLMTGGCFLAAAALGLGALTGFISRPVLRGFALGLAITIILKQLPAVFGVPVRSNDLFRLVADLGSAATQWNVISIGIGAATLMLLLTLRRIPKLPGALIILAIGIGAGIALPLPGVLMVGPVHMALQVPSLPPFTWPLYSRAAQFALPLALILFAESWGTMRGLALRHGDNLEAGRELGALGLANLASAAVSGMPVGAGFSVGNASEGAGAVSRWTAIVAALGLALLITVAGRLVTKLPEPVLAAVVIAALVHMLDPAPLLRLWRLQRDWLLAIAAVAAVLIFGVLNGMLIAVLLSLAGLVRQLAAPRVAQLGRLGDSHDFADIARHPEAVVPPDMAIWRPSAPLFFANAERVLNLIASSSGKVSALVVSLEESADLDSTAVDALIEFDASAAKRGIRVRLARAHDRVRDLLHRAGAHDLAQRSSYSVDDAVRAVAKGE